MGRSLKTLGTRLLQPMKVLCFVKTFKLFIESGPWYPGVCYLHPSLTHLPEDNGDVLDMSWAAEAAVIDQLSLVLIQEGCSQDGHSTLLDGLHFTVKDRDSQHPTI